MIDLIDRTIETTPELEDDYIDDIIKKIQKPADKVRAYAASVGLPENQIVLPFQVLAALYEFNLNNGLRLNEADYLETITKCAYKTVDFILATNNYFGDIESYSIPIQLHIDGLFIRNLINIIVSYFPNLTPEVQQIMRQMLLFQLTQAIFNLGKGDKSILTPVLKRSELFQNVSLKNKRGGGADDEIIVQNESDEPPPSTETSMWITDENGVNVMDLNKVEKTIINIPEIELVERDYSARLQDPLAQNQYEVVNIYGMTLPGNLGAKDPTTGVLYILDLSTKEAAQNFRDLLQSYLNEEYNRNPRARRLIDSIKLKVYHDDEGFLHIEGLPKQYINYVEKAIKYLLPSVRDNTYYFVPSNNYNSKTPNPVTPFTLEPHFIRRRNPEQGPDLPNMVKNFQASPSDYYEAMQQKLWLNQRKSREEEEKAEQLKEEQLNEDQRKIKQMVDQNYEEIVALVRRLSDYNNYNITDEEIANLINEKFGVVDYLMTAMAGKFVIDSINTTAAYEYDIRFTQSMEFLSRLDNIAQSGNFTSVYNDPTIFGSISYTAAGLALMQGAYWWNTFADNYLSIKALTKVIRKKIKAANKLVEQTSLGVTDKDYVELDPDRVREFNEAMQTNDEARQRIAADNLLNSVRDKDYISKEDARRLTNLQTTEALKFIPGAIMDAYQVAQAISTSQTTGTSDKLTRLLGAKLVKWGGTSLLFMGGSYLVIKGAAKGWKLLTENTFNLKHLDPQVLSDFGWQIQAQETQRQFGGPNAPRIDALAIYYNQLVADAAAAAAALPPEVIDYIDEVSERNHFPFHLKCELYIRAAGLLNEYIRNNTPKIPGLFMDQFTSVRNELAIYDNTRIPEEIVTLEAEKAFFAHLKTHIDTLPLIQRVFSVLKELDNLYQEYDRIAEALQQQRSTFTVKAAKFEKAMEESATKQLERIKNEKRELDKRYLQGVAEISKEYGITKTEADTLLRTSQIFEEVAKAFTQVTVNKATEEAKQNLQNRQKAGEVRKLEFERHAKKYITDGRLNWLRNFFFEHSEHGWDNKFEKFIEAADIHNSVGLAASILAFLVGFGGSIGYLKSLWSDEPPGWVVQMLLFLGSNYVTYIAASTVAAFTAIGVPHWLSIAIASTIGIFFSLGVGGRIALTTAVKMWKGFKAGSVLWKWATGKAGISEEKADAIAEAASIGTAALTSALSNGFSEILSPLKLPNAAVNLGSQILPKPLKPLLTPVKMVTEPLSNFADSRIKTDTKMPELSQKSMEAIFPWMKKKPEEKPVKAVIEQEKPKENAQKQNDSVQNINPSRIPTRDGKSTEPVSSKKLKTKPVKVKAPPKTTKQKAREQTKDLRKKQVAKVVLKPRTKLTLKVEKPTPKKKKSKKRASPYIDLYKIFSSSPSKKPRLF